MQNTIETKKPRQSGVELLRIFALMGVVILHYYNANIGGVFPMWKMSSAGSF